MVIGMNILVIDIGTSSMRGILYRKDGKKLYVKQVKYQPTYHADGGVEQEPHDLKGVGLNCRHIRKRPGS